MRREAIEAGVPEKQAQVIASVVREMEYEVSSYVRNAVGLSPTLNFSDGGCVRRRSLLNSMSRGLMGWD